MSKLLFIVSLLLSSILSQPTPVIYNGYDWQGTQIIDSVLAFSNNYRYVPSSGRLWFRADKGIPNAYYATSTGTDAKSFTVPVGSPLNNQSLPFFTFDTVNSQGVDYLIGPVYGSLNKDIATSFGLQLQVSSFDKRVAKLSTTTDNNCYFFSVVIDPQIYSALTVYFYMVGFCYSIDPGMVVSRASAQLNSDKIIINWNPTNDLGIINTGEPFVCYDIWTETSKPQLFFSNESGFNYLYISIPGRCNGIHKIKLPDVGTKFNTNISIEHFTFPDSLKDMRITSAGFDPNSKKFAFASKKFNSVESYLYVFDGQTMSANSGNSLSLRDNEATPILTIDQTTGNIYVAASGFGQVVKFSNILEYLGMAVLPHQLLSVSSMYFVNKTLYVITNDADTEIGRISQDNFCIEYCSEYGYCNGATRSCACIDEYERDPLIPGFVCSPSHVVKYQDQIRQEQGAAAAFGVLFAFAVIAGVAGWFLWFRGRNVQMIK